MIPQDVAIYDQCWRDAGIPLAARPALAAVAARQDDDLHGEALAFLHGAAPIPIGSAAVPARVGRPSGYSEAIADEICDRMINGEWLGAICRDPHMPAKGTVLRWARDNEDFQKNYRFAMEARIDGLVEEAIEIADDGSADYTVEFKGKDGAIHRLKVDNEPIKRSALRVSTRLSAMVLAMPKKYGKAAQEVIPPPQSMPGDDARLVNPMMLEDHPLHEAFQAWEHAGRGK